MSGPSVAQVGAKPAGAAPPAAVGDAAAKLEKGRGLFSDYGCANCHSLADAGATGHVGPALDGDSNLTQDFVVDRVTNGQGMMPSFGGQLSADEINTVAAYIMKVAAK
jgi:mono/diheme cytochrome c family protein